MHSLAPLSHGRQPSGFSVINFWRPVLPMNGPVKERPDTLTGEEPEQGPWTSLVG